MGVPSEALQIIFESWSSQKRTVKKISFSNCKTCFFFIFLHFDPSYFISAKLSQFSVQIQLLNCSEISIELYKSSSNSKGNKIIFKYVLTGSEIGDELVLFRIFCKNYSRFLEGPDHRSD
jgi:hypothetical protein